MKAQYLLAALVAVALLGTYACNGDDDLTQSRLFRPANLAFNADSAGATYTISWTAVKGAVDYSFDICDTAGYSPALVFIDDNATVSVVTFDVSTPTGFRPNTKCWLRVKANTAPGSPTEGSKYAELGFTTPKWDIAQ